MQMYTIIVISLFLLMHHNARLKISFGNEASPPNSAILLIKLKKCYYLLK